MHLRRGSYQVNGVTHPFPNGITVSSAPLIWRLQNIVKLWSFYVDTDHLATGHARGELNCFSWYALIPPHFNYCFEWLSNLDKSGQQTNFNEADALVRHQWNFVLFTSYYNMTKAISPRPSANYRLFHRFLGSHQLVAVSPRLLRLRCIHLY